MNKAVTPPLDDLGANLKEPLSLRDYVALVAFRELIKSYNSVDWDRFCVSRAFATADSFVARRKERDDV